MKQVNLMLMISIGFIIYFSGCYPFNTGIYDNNNFDAVVIDIPPETPDMPLPIYIEPPPDQVPPSYPYPKPVQTPVKYRPVQPVNLSSDQNVKEERPSSQNNNSRDNSGLRNESTGRRR
jgi:hypothetical protein